MKWWFSRSPARRPSEAGQIHAGPERSPGFELLCQRIATKSPNAILDLGPSSTENLEFLATLCDNVMVQDLFHSAGEQGGQRSTVFHFDDAHKVPLPSKRKFDVVLMWDLLHYFEASERAPFVKRLARICQEGALVLVMGSAIAPIPRTPIHFKIEAKNRLNYVIDSEEWADSPGLNTRTVESAMKGFAPMRLFQLRNGLQEFLFVRERDTPTQLKLH